MGGPSLAVLLAVAMFPRHLLRGRIGPDLLPAGAEELSVIDLTLARLPFWIARFSLPFMVSFAYGLPLLPLLSLVSCFISPFSFLRPQAFMTTRAPW